MNPKQKRVKSVVQTPAFCAYQVGPITAHLMKTSGNHMSFEVDWNPLQCDVNC